MGASLTAAEPTPSCASYAKRCSCDAPETVKEALDVPVGERDVMLDGALVGDGVAVLTRPVLVDSAVWLAQEPVLHRNMEEPKQCGSSTGRSPVVGVPSAE